MRIFLYLMALIISVTAMSLSGYAFIFFVIGMLPTIVSSLIDKRISKAASNTVGAFNLMGIFPYLMDLWHAGATASNKAQLMVINVNIWFIIYSASALGWLVIWGLPNIMGNFFIYRSKNKIETYRSEQLKLYTEWGVNISKTTFKDYYISNKVIDNKDK